MKKNMYIIPILLGILMATTTKSQENQNYYFSSGERHYFYDDSTSINIVVRNMSNYSIIVSRLQTLFNSPNDEVLHGITYITKMKLESKIR